MSHSIIQQDAKNISNELGELNSMLFGKKILVTGAAGFLCSYFVDILSIINKTVLDNSMQIIAVDNYLRGVPERLEHLKNNKCITIENVDVTKPYNTHITFDFIVHGASIASPFYYRQYPLETIDVNVNGLKNMLEISRQSIQSVIYLSSSEIYGDPDPSNIPTSEDYLGNVSCTGPRACYDESKRLGETLCIGYHNQYDVPVKIIRPFNVYGPGQQLDDKRIVPDLLSSIIKNKPIVLFSDGKATRSFCYASDFIVGMLLVMLKGKNGLAYNVGNAQEITILEAAKIASALDDKNLTVKYKTSEDKHYLADNPQRRCPDLTRVGSLGYASKITFTEGISRTLRYYQNHTVNV